jgi:SWI/SNF-related matrix-associated actin-dependent regulator 1 of chromatin subfamily A
VEWGIQPTKQAREKLGAVLVKQAEMRASIAKQTEENIELVLPHAPELNAAMKNYQKAGVIFMATNERAYNGDSMGLGKSLQLLASFEMTMAYPAIVLCPVKLKQNWIKECRRWLPHRKASMFVNDLADVTILGYSEIHKYVNWQLVSSKKSEKAKGRELRDSGKKFFFPDMVKVSGIACDEGHFIKLPSRRTHCATAIAEFCDARVRYVLSGTPIENKNSELIAPMKFLGVLEKMGGWYHVATKYCGAKRNNFGLDLGESTNCVAFNKHIRDVFYIRREKRDVLKELADKIQTVFEAEIDNEPEYRKIERDVVSYLVDKGGKLLERNQLETAHLLRMGALRQAVARGKLAWIIEWVEEFLESGEKIVLFGFHQCMLNGLVEGLKHRNPAKILGGCLDVNREVEKFQRDDSCRVCVASIVSAGFGINGLQEVCSHIAICELMWTHTKHLNAIDRLHRIGQKSCVNAYYFLASGTIDDLMWSINSDKTKIVTATVDGEEVPPAEALVNLVRKQTTRN